MHRTRAAAARSNNTVSQSALAPPTSQGKVEMKRGRKVQGGSETAPEASMQPQTTQPESGSTVAKPKRVNAKAKPADSNVNAKDEHPTATEAPVSYAADEAETEKARKRALSGADEEVRKPRKKLQSEKGADTENTPSRNAPSAAPRTAMARTATFPLGQVPSMISPNKKIEGADKKAKKTAESSIKTAEQIAEEKAIKKAAHKLNGTVDPNASDEDSSDLTDEDGNKIPGKGKEVVEEKQATPPRTPARSAKPSATSVSKLQQGLLIALQTKLNKSSTPAQSTSKQPIADGFKKATPAKVKKENTSAVKIKTRFGARPGSRRRAISPCSVRAADLLQLVVVETDNDVKPVIKREDFKKPAYNEYDLDDPLAVEVHEDGTIEIIDMDSDEVQDVTQDMKTRIANARAVAEAKHHIDAQIEYTENGKAASVGSQTNPVPHNAFHNAIDFTFPVVLLLLDDGAFLRKDKNDPHGLSDADIDIVVGAEAFKMAIKDGDEFEPLRERCESSPNFLNLCDEAADDRRSQFRNKLTKLAISIVERAYDIAKYLKAAKPNSTTIMNVISTLITGDHFLYDGDLGCLSAGDSMFKYTIAEDREDTPYAHPALIQYIASAFMLGAQGGHLFPEEAFMRTTTARMLNASGGEYVYVDLKGKKVQDTYWRHVKAVTESEEPGLSATLWTALLPRSRQVPRRRRLSSTRGFRCQCVERSAIAYLVSPASASLRIMLSRVQQPPRLFRVHPRRSLAYVNIDYSYAYMLTIVYSSRISANAPAARQGKARSCDLLLRGKRSPDVVSPSTYATAAEACSSTSAIISRTAASPNAKNRRTYISYENGLRVIIDFADLVFDVRGSTSFDHRVRWTMRTSRSKSVWAERGPEIRPTQKSPLYFRKCSTVRLQMARSSTSTDARNLLSGQLLELPRLLTQHTNTDVITHCMAATIVDDARLPRCEVILSLSSMSASPPHSPPSADSGDPFAKAARVTGIKQRLKDLMSGGSKPGGSAEGTENAKQGEASTSEQNPPLSTPKKPDRKVRTLQEEDVATPRPRGTNPTQPSTSKEPSKPLSAKAKSKLPQAPVEPATEDAEDLADEEDNGQEEEEVESVLFSEDQVKFMWNLADRAASRAAKIVLAGVTSRKRTASAASLNVPEEDPSDAPPDTGDIFAPWQIKKAKGRGKAKLDLEKRVRNRTKELIGNPKPFGPPVDPERKAKAAEVYERLTVDPGTRQGFKFDLGDLQLPEGFSVENGFAIEYIDRPHCPWNMLMVQLCVDDFLLKHPGEVAARVEEAFWAHIKHLVQEQRIFERDKRDALNRVTDLPVVRAERKARNRRAARPTLIFDRRVKVAEDLPENADPRRQVLALVVSLTKKGMSDDESDGEGGRVARRPIWRAPFIRQYLTMLDYLGRIALETKRTLALDQRGRRPEHRLPGQPGAELVNPKRAAVRGLPHNLYDGTWLASQSPAYIQRQICPRKETFAIPPEFLSYVAGLNASAAAGPSS
ncbi:hypothetical protein PENSPDRAFT_662722 [Peniophora sp. CONT]|nr:hypothetical protein PENSPDRAFT_662722 [Peniophora sp. CONT]